jgi:hypothetical protein
MMPLKKLNLSKKTSIEGALQRKHNTMRILNVPIGGFETMRTKVKIKL